MGQKVNPIGFRLGFNKNWSSHWFAGKGYAAALHEDAAIRGLIVGKFQRAGVSEVEIFRNRGDVVVSIYSAKPGILIGRAGVGAQELRRQIDLAVQRTRKVSTKPNVRVNIMEVKNPELSAKVVAENIANQIERRISVKRAIRLSLERTMERGAKGIKIKVAGRLNGAEIARDEMMSRGSIPLQTLRSVISYALSEAKTTYGVIGIKVWIYTGQSEEVPTASAPEQPVRPARAPRNA